MRRRYASAASNRWREEALCFPVYRPAVRPLPVTLISRDATFLSLVERFQLKLGTNICHVCGHCWRGFQGQRSINNRIIVQQKVEANGQKQATTYSTLLWM